MSPHNSPCTFLEKTIKGWSFIGIDATGKLGGLIIGWKDNICVENIFVMHLGLFIEFLFEGMNQSFKTLNVYGPYLDKR